MTLYNATGPGALPTSTLSAAGTTFSQPGACEDGVDWLTIAVNLTAIGGTTPSLTLSVQWSFDGTNWYDADTADSFTALSAVGKVVKRFNVKGTRFRLKEVLSGTTPTATYTATTYDR